MMKGHLLFVLESLTVGGRGVCVCESLTMRVCVTV